LLIADCRLKSPTMSGWPKPLPARSQSTISNRQSAIV
jgi:hypothetical protein